MEALGQAPDPEDARLRLRAALRRITEVAMLLIVPRGHARLCAVQFHFRGGAQRSYLLYYCPAAKRFGKPTPAEWLACSLDDAAQLGPLDLRKRADAHKLEALLAGVGLEGLLAAMQPQPTLKKGKGGG
jgi:hypothetical protein